MRLPIIREDDELTAWALVAIVALVVALLRFLPVAHAQAPAVTTVQWGLPGDLPVACDYDNDRITDVAVYRPSTGTWYLQFSNRTFPRRPAGFQWGLPGDVPAPGDFNGDGACDLVVFRPSTGTWHLRYSEGGNLF